MARLLKQGRIGLIGFAGSALAVSGCHSLDRQAQNDGRYVSARPVIENEARRPLLLGGYAGFNYGRGADLAPFPNGR